MATVQPMLPATGWTPLHHMAPSCGTSAVATSRKACCTWCFHKHTWHSIIDDRYLTSLHCNSKLRDAVYMASCMLLATLVETVKPVQLHTAAMQARAERFTTTSEVVYACSQDVTINQSMQPGWTHSRHTLRCRMSLFLTTSHSRHTGLHPDQP